MTLLLDQVADADLPRTPIKLAFFDIDSTLLGRSGVPSDALRREIGRIQSMGIKTAVASGRPYFSARPVIESLGLWSAGCFFTGGALIDPVDDRLLAGRTVDREEVEALVRVAEEEGVYTELYTLEDYFVQAQHPFSEVHAGYMGRLPLTVDLRSLAASAPIYKMLLVTHEEREREALERVMARLPGLTFATGYGARHADIVFSSVVSREACKRSAFELLIARHGVRPEEVIAFGDGGSDKDFLRLAGVGVAMGNAKPDVQACGNFVTRSVEEDGVAYALSRLVR